MNIMMVHVESKMIHAIGYDKATQTVSVQFRNGDVWHYLNVPEDTYETVRDARSVGQEFNELIKNDYEGVKQ